MTAPHGHEPPPPRPPADPVPDGPGAALVLCLAVPWVAGVAYLTRLAVRATLGV